MSKTISEQQVIDSAKCLVNKGQRLTLSAVRKQLNNRGSITTIHKYLQKWKQQCFEQNNEVRQPLECDTQLIKEKHNLEQALNKQIAQNQYYTQELINVEKANIVLKEEIQQLQTQLRKLQSELNELRNINKFLEQTTTEIKNKLENNDNKTIQNLQQTVDNLRSELKKINETSLEALRIASTTGHEALMQEKVTSINLQAKLDSLHKELADSKKQLFDATLKYQAQTQALLRQIDWQQKIIKEQIGEDKLRELTADPELMLNFNSKLGLVYAK